MKMAVKKWLYWAPRALGVAFILFISLFALDVFGTGRGFWATALALLMHLIPVFFAAIVLALSWRWEWVGAFLFTVLGVLYVVWAWGRFNWAAYTFISGPLFLLGALFLLNWVYRAEIRNAETSKSDAWKGRICLAIMAAFLALSSGCARLDVKDPRQVGEAGWRAIERNDIKALRKLALPEDRHKFTAEAIKAELDRLPPLPDTIIVVMEITGERGQALVKDWAHPYGLQMVNKKGRWWVEW
jgi:hypothetical protein